MTGLLSVDLAKTFKGDSLGICLGWQTVSPSNRLFSPLAIICLLLNCPLSGKGFPAVEVKEPLNSFFAGVLPVNSTYKEKIDRKKEEEEREKERESVCVKERERERQREKKKY
jgi:hypothetical protein